MAILQRSHIGHLFLMQNVLLNSPHPSDTKTQCLFFRCLYENTSIKQRRIAVHIIQESAESQKYWIRLLTVLQAVCMNEKIGSEMWERMKLRLNVFVLKHTSFCSSSLMPPRKMTRVISRPAIVFTGTKLLIVFGFFLLRNDVYSIFYVLP